MPEDKKAEEDAATAGENSALSLVPLYSPLDISKGLQAYRRGDLILYTVRGEPAKVHELMEELNNRGINDVVALISHRADIQEPEDIADAVVADSEDIKDGTGDG